MTFALPDLPTALEGLLNRRATNARYEAAPENSGARWDAIRDAWALRMPLLEAGRRCDPYFLNWQFTPIERNAWSDIRCVGIPLYPQCPVAGVFIDFADPHLKIGLELDGQAFHDRERDTLRDERLWRQGWRIFRITGAESYRMLLGPLDEAFGDDSCSEAEWMGRLDDWARTTLEGVIWSLGVLYYGKRPNSGEHERAVAARALALHRLADFPLSLDGAEDV